MNETLNKLKTQGFTIEKVKVIHKIPLKFGNVLSKLFYPKYTENEILKYVE